MSATPPPGFEWAEEGVWSIVAPRDRLDDARAVMRGRSVAGILHPGAPAGGAGGPAAGRGLIVEAATPLGRELVLKVLRKGGLGARARGAFHGRARLLTELGLLAEALRRGISTATPAFGATARMDDGRLAAVLATEKLAGAVTLAAILAEPPSGPERARDRRGAVARAGAAVRGAHDRGLHHSDLNLGNVLVSAVPPGAWVIDLGVSKLGAPLSPSQRAENLVRLLRSVEKHLGRDPRRLRDAAAFLRGYVGRGGGEARRRFREDLIRSIKRRLPGIVLHRIGWSLTRRGHRARPRRS